VKTLGRLNSLLNSSGLPIQALLIAATLAVGILRLFQDHTAVAAIQPQRAIVARGVVDIEGGIVRVAATRDGIIQDVFAKEGQLVAAGEALATLDDTAARLAVSEAQAEAIGRHAALQSLEVRLAMVKRDAAHLAMLARHGAVSQHDAYQAVSLANETQADLDQAKSAAAVADAHVEQAKYELHARGLWAPVAGKIVTSRARIGLAVAASDKLNLFILEPGGPRVVRAELDELFLDNVVADMPARIIPDGLSNQEYPARVLRIGDVLGVQSILDETNSRSDGRVADVMLAVEGGDRLRIGQRVLVRFGR